MKDRVKRNFNYLTLLGKCKNTMRKAILKESDKDLVAAVCDCVLNISNGVIPLNANVKSKLRRHKLKLRNLTKKNLSIKKKRRLLIQHGGSILPILLPIVTTAIASLLQ